MGIPIRAFYGGSAGRAALAALKLDTIQVVDLNRRNGPRLLNQDRTDSTLSILGI
jgi:hypothetical protein